LKRKKIKIKKPKGKLQKIPKIKKENGSYLMDKNLALFLWKPSQ
jgi:hypothetical protein